MKNTLKKIATVFCTVLALDMISCQQEVEHVHTFSDTWSFDERIHWHEATCGHVDEVDSLACHEFSDWDEGKRICVTCGYEENCTHSFTDWRTVTEPTEEDDGLKERNCLSCGHKETDLIFALGHHHNIKSEWSSDETSHWHAYDCGRSEHFEDKAAHIEDSGTVTKEPTCTEKGSMVYKCTVCKKVIRTEDIATEHSYGGWVSTDSSKHWKECAECGKKIEAAHSYGDWTSTDGKHWKECECGKKIEEAVHNFIYKDNGWQKCEICDKENSTPVSLDVLGTYDSTKMTFGVYPQTIKASSVTVDKAVKNTEITGADYYLGSDGAWYAECIENAYDTGNQNKYSDGSTVAQKEANSVKYFKVEPIEWVYLAKTKCLHAKKILTANVQWHESSNNYANSNIRRWLNGTFYDSAFTENQKKKIRTTTVDNSAVSTGKSTNGYACEDTNDNVYLLSETEAITTGNGFTEYYVYGAGNSRIRFPTDYALANYCYKHGNSSLGGYWWLRSPWYGGSDVARFIRIDGDARIDFGKNVSDETVGVVPALSISE